MGRLIIASVSKDALRHNLQQIRSLAPRSKILAMVKANAYGHGLRSVAKTLNDVDAFGVACPQEAILLRHNGIKNDIVLMEGIFNYDDLHLAQIHRLAMVVHNHIQLDALKNYSASLSQKFKIWIKVNTGMNRLGFKETEFDDVWRTLSQDPKVELIGSMTHFGQADEIDNSVTLSQCEKLNYLMKDRPGCKSLANSAGILAWPQSHADWVRPGLMLYGASPFTNSTGLDHHLRPAMSVRSEIIALNKLSQGEKVGYGGMWQNQNKSSTIAIVAIGYGDGYPWHAKSGTPVLINQQRAYTAGRVSMDMLAVDVTNIDSVKVGDSVTLWGEGLPIEEVARCAGTIPYELFCRFTERVTMQLI